MGFLGGSDVKESACDVGDLGLIPGLGRSPGGGNGNPLQYSCLGNPMDRRAWPATVQGVAKSWTRLKQLSTHVHAILHSSGTSLQKKEGVTRKLVGFKLIDRGVPRHEYELADLEGNVIGHVTSGTMSPCLKVGVGMGYVKPEFAKAGTQIAVVVRGRLLKAEVVRLPFV